MKVLIAEDDITSRTMLTGILKNGGHEVIETINGAEAWQILQQPGAPLMVILDWMMPEMDGPEVLRQVRSLPTDCPPYIIMLTARGGAVDIVAGLSAGANDYLTKPIEPGEILARVEVGQRMIEMQLRQHRQRTNAQVFRVEANRRIDELQATLASKVEELRRTQTSLRALESRLQAVP